MAMCICTLLLLRQPRPVKAKGGLVRRVFRAGLAFYLLLDGSRLKKYLLSIRSTKRKKSMMDKFLNRLDADLSHVFVGNIMTAVFTGVIGMLLFTVLNYSLTGTNLQIPYPTMLGLFCGITSLVPVVGVALVWVPVGIYLAVQAYMKNILFMYWWLPIFYMISTFVIADWLPNILIRPRLSGGRMHKGAMMFAYVFGSVVFGFKGLFIGPMVLIGVVDYFQVMVPKLSDSI